MQPLDFLPTCNILTGLHNKENCYKLKKHYMISTENMHWTIGCATWESNRVSKTEIINGEGERV